MLGLLQKLLKGGSLIIIGIIFGVAIGGVKPSAPVLSQQVSPSPLPITSDIQGVATQVPTIASPSASIEPIPSVKPTIAPTPKQTPKSTIPDAATAICRDGTYSFSQSRSGTCSHHGGVSQWL